MSEREQRSVYVIGAGGHAKVIVRILERLGYELSALFDDNRDLWGTRLLGVPILGPITKIATAAPRPTVIAVGNNQVRSQIAATYELEYLTVIDPCAIVDSSVTIGCGTVVFPGSVISVDSVLGEHVIVNHGTTVDHDCTVDSFAHLCPGVHLAGGVIIGMGVMMGIGAVAIPGARIGSWTIIGAGSAVVKSLPGTVVAAGTPARVLRSLSPEESHDDARTEDKQPLTSDHTAEFSHHNEE